MSFLFKLAWLSFAAVALYKGSWAVFGYLVVAGLTLQAVTVLLVGWLVTPLMRHLRVSRAIASVAAFGPGDASAPTGLEERICRRLDWIIGGQIIAMFAAAGFAVAS